MKPARRQAVARKADNRARRRYRAYLAASMIAVATPTPAQQPMCGATPIIHGILARDYGEESAAHGMARAGALLELWANRDTGSWSLLITMPDGITCIIEAGRSFQSFAARPNL